MLEGIVQGASKIEHDNPFFTLMTNMSRSNATRCDWLRARCLAPRGDANLAAVSSQFWKTVRVAQHQAATPPCLSRGIRSTAVKMDEKLYLSFTKLGPILTAWDTSPKKRLGACNILQTASTRGVPQPFV